MSFRPFYFVVAAMVFLADRASKLWIEQHIALGRARVVVPKVFRLTHVLNTGAAFSLFAGNGHAELVRKGLIAFSVMAMVAMLYLILRDGRRFGVSNIACALILGGAAGNLFDRIKSGEVIDFLEVHLGSYHYPDFNVADSCIVVGAVMIFLASLTTDTPVQGSGKRD